MATVLTPESPTQFIDNRPTMFLAGSIEMGIAKDWQSGVIKRFENDDIILLNPRREDWDSSWKQEIQNEPFRRQVEWELTGLEIADAIMLYFDPDTLSPISIAEFAFYAGRNSTGCLNKMIVYCPNGFYRKGNIDIMAARYKIPVVDTMENLISGSEFLMRRNHERRVQYQGYAANEAMGRLR